MKPNLVPLDKFKPENIVRAYEYLKTLFFLHPYKVIFADEKQIKGQELFSDYVRVSPLDNTHPVILTTGDFRNTHSVTAFCSINQNRAAPIWFRIHNGTNDAAEFRTSCKAHKT